MKNNKKIKSKESAIENTKRFFSNAPDKDAVSIGEAFLAWGRPNPENIELHKAWLSNILFHLKYHNLIAPVYTFNTGRKKLEKLQLTLEGKKALGRIGENVNNNNGVSPTTSGSGNAIDFKNVRSVIAKLKEANPEFEITSFEMKLKTDKG